MSAALEVKQNASGGLTVIGRSRLYGSAPVELLDIALEASGTFLAVPKSGVSLAGNVQKRTLTIGHAELTDADGSQTVNIGAALPANARIVGCDIRALTVFTGGAVSAVAVDIGTSGDVDAIVDGADLLSAAVDGGPATMTKGVRPNKTFATGGAQLIATFLATGGTLADLTAGAVTIDVLFTVLE